MKNKVKETEKDVTNCPFCQAEGRGVSDAWGMSPEAWSALEEKHKKNHGKPKRV